MTIPDKPRSSEQKYITVKLKQLKKYINQARGQCRTNFQLGLLIVRTEIWLAYVYKKHKIENNNKDKRIYTKFNIDIFVNIHMINYVKVNKLIKNLLTFIRMNARIILLRILVKGQTFIG